MIDDDQAWEGCGASWDVGDLKDHVHVCEEDDPVHSGEHECICGARW